MGYEPGVVVGLKNVFFAPLVIDDDTGAAYDKPFRIGHAITVKPSFELTEGNLSADDRVIIEYSELTGIKFQINIAAFKPAVLAKLLGHRMDANGGTIIQDGDTPLEGALLYQVSLHNNKNKYVCVYKGAFKEFAEESQTKQKGSVNFQTPTIEYTAYRRVDGKLKYEISEDTPGYSESAVEQWFKEVPEAVEGDMAGTGSEIEAG